MNLDAVNLDALCLVKLIFGKYLCYFDSDCIAATLQLQLYFDANYIPVCESINIAMISAWSQITFQCARELI